MTPPSTSKISEHGEILARLTAIVEQDHEDLKELKSSTAIIAKFVAEQKTRNAMIHNIVMYALPFLTTIISFLAGHFLK